jgi:hypothetical protein
MPRWLRGVLLVVVALVVLLVLWIWANTLA